MKYEEVQGHLADILTDVYFSLHPYYVLKDDPQKPTKIMTSRHIGGMSGGSCWGDEAQPYQENEEFKHDILLMLLDRICPNITLLQYKKLGKFRELSPYTSYEYYGNHTTYEIEIYSLKQVYDTRVSLEAI